jgi:DinB superfamily
MNNILQETSDKLLDAINDAKARFTNNTPQQWDEKPSENGWNKKEILGHLIDSAANNHLRFVRAQLADGTFKSHAYEQDFFVDSQHYRDMPATEIIELWYAYNRQLAHVIKYIDPSKLSVTCFIGEYEPVTFSFVITDYVTHMVHHLEEIYQ